MTNKHLLPMILGSTILASSTLGQFRLDVKELATPATEDAASDTNTNKNLLPERGRIVFVRHIQNKLFARYGSAAAAKNKLHQDLEAWIDRLDRTRHLSLAQRSKLVLAGRHDIESFFREAADLQNSQMDDLRELSRQIQNLEARIKEGICSEGSVLSKVARRVIAESKNQDQNIVAPDRTEFSHRAALKIAIAEIEQLVPLTSDQRTDLLEYLMEKREIRKRPTKCDVIGAINVVNRQKENLDSILTKQQIAALDSAIKSAAAGMLTRLKLEFVDEIR